jgi:hypothetical protein
VIALTRLQEIEFFDERFSISIARRIFHRLFQRAGKIADSVGRQRILLSGIPIFPGEGHWPAAKPALVTAQEKHLRISGFIRSGRGRIARDVGLRPDFLLLRPAGETFR